MALYMRLILIAVAIVIAIEVFTAPRTGFDVRQVALILSCAAVVYVALKRKARE